jgi:hypothetical protein
MALTTPDWLARRSGSVQPANAGEAWLVFLNGEPQYRVIPIPVGGKFGCHVVQTVNGKHLGCNGRFPTAEDALRGGLEDLRMALGW